jgi:hypothetical protein
MSLGRHDQFSLILILHCLPIILLTSILVYFLHFEYCKFGKDWKRVFENRFIRATAIGCATLILNSLVFIQHFMTHYGVFSSYRMTAEQDAIVLFVCCFIILIACFAHIYLLYLRTKGIFEGNKHLMRFMKIMVRAIFVFSTLAMATGIGELIPNNPAFGTFRNLFSLSSGLYALCTAMVDIATSISFARYVHELSKGLKGQRFADRTTRSTFIVARYGMIISPIAFASVVIYILERIQTDSLNQEWIFVFTIWGLYCVAILWTVMKLQLDRNNEDVESPKVKLTRQSLENHPHMKSLTGTLSQPLIEVPGARILQSAEQEFVERSPNDSLSQQNTNEAGNEAALLL